MLVQRPPRIAPPPVPKVGLRHERRGRAMRPRFRAAASVLATHATAALSRWTHRVGVSGLRASTTPPPGTPSDLARRSSVPLRLTKGGLSPWRSVLPPRGGGAAQLLWAAMLLATIASPLA